MLKIHPNIAKLQPYQPGRPIEEIARNLNIDAKNIIKLASNENPLGISPMVKEALIKTLKSTEISRYPDGDAFTTKRAISDYYRISPKRLTFGNGSNELLEIIAHTFVNPNDEIIYSQYAFIVYPIVAQIISCSVKEITAINYKHDLKGMANAISDKTRLIFIANPNNPTGTFCTEEEIKKFLDRIPSNIVVVLDEAYTEFVDPNCRIDSFSLLENYDNLIVLRSFSKAFSLAAFRFGIAFSSEKIISYINRVRQPFNTNTLSQIAAATALKDKEFLNRTVENNNQGMKYLSSELERLNIDYIPSKANFITIQHPQSDKLNSFLLSKGLIVRPLGMYKMHHFIRVSIGTESENKFFIKLLKEFLHSEDHSG